MRSWIPGTPIPIWLVALAGVVACCSVGWGYLVGPPVSLAEMTQKADIVFKGTAMSTGPAKDEWFKPVGGFAVRETKFRAVSVLKGEATVETVAFRHYDRAPDPRSTYNYSPQQYHFEKDRTYLVFAAQTGTAGVFRQLWAAHTMKNDQGAMRCGDDKPVASKDVKEVVWAELTAMLASRDADDATYAARQLGQMSAMDQDYLLGIPPEFSREETLKIILPLIRYPDPKVATAAIGVVGDYYRQLPDESLFRRSLTAASNETSGTQTTDPRRRNPGGRLYWKDLVAVADTAGTTQTRAASIHALGLVKEPGVREAVERWLADPVPAVRAEATLLLADYPGEDTRRRLTALAADDAPGVRAAAAAAAGYSRQTETVGLLASLLADQDRNVREAAARSLLSFPPKDEAVANALRENVGNPEFGRLFLLPLARLDPEKYRDDLTKVVTEKPAVHIPWGGQEPAFTAWEILLKYVRDQPAEKVRAGEFDRYLDAIERVGNYSSSEPRDIYAFYVQRGMTERAKRYREEAKKKVTYDLDYFFNMVDAHPSHYTRQ